MNVPSEIRSHRSSIGILWVIATVIGMFLSLLVVEAAYFQGDYIPTGNDSFYHARRMLETAVGDGFYQYDDRIDVPDGIWIPWPWAYDWLMGKAAALAVWISPSSDPLAFLAYVPVAWIGVNVGIFLAATRRAGLQTGYAAVAMLAIALAPFLQLMHMVGKVDHHFVEFTFVLLVTYFGLRWFTNTDDRFAAIGLGVSLGLSPGFHIGLFVLQLPVLMCAAVLWLRGSKLSPTGLRTVSIVLVFATALVVIPSAPFREGMFEFGLLSGFHLYVGACSAVVLTYFGWKRFDVKALCILLVLGLVLLMPVIGQLLQGAAFVSRDVKFLENVIEATGPFDLIGQFGTAWVVAHYSWLLFAAPPLLLYFMWSAVREFDPARVFVAVMSVFGIAFMLLQFRFNYFGLFPLIVGPLLIVQRLAERYDWNRGLVAVAMLGGLLLAYQPPLRDKLFDVYALGAAPIYERARPIFLELGERCASRAGTVLADKHDGNYLLFHTDCSITSNNFMQTTADLERISQFSKLMKLVPEELRSARPDVRYVLVRAWDYYEERDGVIMISGEYPLATALLGSDETPPGFELIGEVWVERNGRELLYARAFEISEH